MTRDEFMKALRTADDQWDDMPLSQWAQQVADCDAEQRAEIERLQADSRYAGDRIEQLATQLATANENLDSMLAYIKHCHPNAARITWWNDKRNVLDLRNGTTKRKDLLPHSNITFSNLEFTEKELECAQRIASQLVLSQQQQVEKLKAELATAKRESFNAKRFEYAPCYLCGYNGPRYYQPDTHACATLYHQKEQR